MFKFVACCKVNPNNSLVIGIRSDNTDVAQSSLRVNSDEGIANANLTRKPAKHADYVGTRAGIFAWVSLIQATPDIFFGVRRGYGTDFAPSEISNLSFQKMMQDGAIPPGADHPHPVA